jgi:hypothetical protein
MMTKMTQRWKITTENHLDEARLTVDVKKEIE